MILDKINRQYNRIMSRLSDEESVNIFNSRVEYMITRDANKLSNDLYDSRKKYTCEEIDNLLENNEYEIIIFGAGSYGKKTKINLERCKKYQIKAFCDNNEELIGKSVEGLPVIDVNTVVNEKESIVIIATIAYSKEIYAQLIGLGVEPKRIVVPTLGYPEIQCGWQYFDLFNPNKKEVFIDAGTYDGGTIEEFYKWTGKNEGICLGMEPILAMYNVANDRVNKLGLYNTKIYNLAAWNKNEELEMQIDEKTSGEIWGGSHVVEGGCTKVKAGTIDSIIEQNQSGVTMIKMDVEGSELKALEGASHSIVKFKPRLAISVYHRPDDILEIADYILDLVEDYKLYLRHYTGDLNETVLYASV